MRRVEGRSHCYEKLKSQITHPITAQQPQQPWQPHRSAAPAVLPSEGAGRTPPWVCPFGASYLLIKGWFLVQYQQQRLCSLLSHSLRHCLCPVFSFSWWKAPPPRTISLLTISVTLHSPKYTTGKRNPPIPAATRHKCKTRWHILNEEPRKGHLFLHLHTHPEDMAEGKIISNPSHRYSFSLEVFTLGWMCLRNAYQIRPTPLLLGVWRCLPPAW